MPSSCWPTLSSTTRAWTRRRSRSVASRASCALKSDQAIERAEDREADQEGEPLGGELAREAGLAVARGACGRRALSGAVASGRRRHGRRRAEPAAGGARRPRAPPIRCRRRSRAGAPSRGRARWPAHADGGRASRPHDGRPQGDRGADRSRFMAGHRQRGAEVKAAVPLRRAGVASAMLDGFTVLHVRIPCADAVRVPMSVRVLSPAERPRVAPRRAERRAAARRRLRSSATATARRAPRRSARSSSSPAPAPARR